MDFRIGHGLDVHRLVSGRKLILCGVEIPYMFGLLGHGDADVAAHAVADALLGALALGDIGHYFPDTDPAYAGADSMELLRHAASLPQFEGWEISNLDLTIIAERPKIAPYRDAMRGNLASVLEIDVARVSVKATTTEKLGFTGRGEGIAADCTVLIGQRV